MTQVREEVAEASESINYLVVASVMTVMFLAAIENMITSTILPSVISSIGGLALYPWVASIFMLSSTITLPLYGTLSDIYGHKKFTLLAIFIFLVGSGLCGAARSMEQLIIFRAIQGMGAGGLITMSFILFGIIFPKEKRGKMQALLTAMWAVASIVGPALGAIFVQYLNWRWAFYINLPFGFISFWMLATFFKIPHEYKVDHSIDYKGVVLFSAGMLTLLYGLLSIGQGTVSAPEIITLGAGIIILVYLVSHERKVAEPILPVKQFSDRIFSSSVLLNFIAAACLFSTINFIPIFLQGVLGAQPGTVGQILMAISLGWVSGSFICGRNIGTAGLRTLILSGAFSLTTGFLLMNLLNENSPYWQIVIYEIFLGLGMGIIATGTLVAVQSTASKANIGSSTSGVQLFRSIGGTMGISILGGVQVGYFKNEIAKAVSGNPGSPLALIASEPHKILDPISRAKLPPDILHNLAGFLAISIHQVFFFALIISIFGIFFAFRLPKENLYEYIKK